MVINGLDIQSVNNDRENNGQIENYSSQDDKCMTFNIIVQFNYFHYKRETKLKYFAFKFSFPTI